MKMIKINPERGRYFARIRENMSKPKNWKLGFTLFAGKMIGLVAVILGMMLIP